LRSTNQNKASVGKGSDEIDEDGEVGNQVSAHASRRDEGKAEERAENELAGLVPANDVDTQLVLELHLVMNMSASRRRDGFKKKKKKKEKRNVPPTPQRP
jgi:hypothetical protein